MDNFVSNDEMAGYANEAIDVAEAEIISIKEDYFVTSSGLTLVQGTSDYDLPSNIYAQKIKEIVYANGPKIYEILPLRAPRKFLEKALLDYNPSGESEYNYILKSVTAGAQDKIVLVPTAQESGAYVTIWYHRNANRIGMVNSGELITRSAQLATVIDIPEFYLYLVEHMKVRCKEKEVGATLPVLRENLKIFKDEMVETLTERMPDNNNTVPPDLTIYEEHS